MGSTTKRIIAELQYAKRTMFSSALRKMKPTQRYAINNMVDLVYRRMVKTDLKINKTDVFRLLASIGALSAFLDPKYAGSS